MYKHKHNFKWRKKGDLVVREPALAVRVNHALLQILCIISSKLFQASIPPSIWAPGI